MRLTAKGERWLLRVYTIAAITGCMIVAVLVLGLAGAIETGGM